MLLVVIVSRQFSFHCLGVLILSFAAVQLPPSTVNDLTPILIPSPSVSRPLSLSPFVASCEVVASRRSHRNNFSLSI